MSASMAGRVETASGESARHEADQHMDCERTEGACWGRWLIVERSCVRVKSNLDVRVAAAVEVVVAAERVVAAVASWVGDRYPPAAWLLLFRCEEGVCMQMNADVGG